MSKGFYVAKRPRGFVEQLGAVAHNSRLAIISYRLISYLISVRLLALSRVSIAD